MEFPYAGYPAHMQGVPQVPQAGYRNSWCPGAATLPSDQMTLLVSDNCALRKTYQFDGALYSSCAVQRCSEDCGPFCQHPACYENSLCSVVPLGALQATEFATTSIVNSRSGEISDSAYYILFGLDGQEFCTPAANRKRSTSVNVNVVRQYYPASDEDPEWYMQAAEIKTSPGTQVLLNKNSTDLVYWRNETLQVRWRGFPLNARLEVVLVQPGISRYRADAPASQYASGVSIYLGGRMFEPYTRFNYVLVRTLPTAGNLTDASNSITGVSREFSIL